MEGACVAKLMKREQSMGFTLKGGEGRGHRNEKGARISQGRVGAGEGQGMGEGKRKRKVSSVPTRWGISLFTGPTTSEIFQVGSEIDRWANSNMLPVIG